MNLHGDCLVPGDVIWFSVALLRQIADEPDPVRVELREIVTNPDGTKTLVLDRIERPNEVLE